jgi:hypothetical protein
MSNQENDNLVTCSYQRCCDGTRDRDANADAKIPETKCWTFGVFVHADAENALEFSEVTCPPSR